MSAIEPQFAMVPLHDTQILSFHDGTRPYACVRTVCAHCGLDWDYQYAKLLAVPAFVENLKTFALPANYGGLTIVMLALDVFQAWLDTLDDTQPPAAIKALN